MIPGIDRVLIAVADLTQASRLLETSLGLAAAGGGVHHDRGAHSTLFPLGNALLEVIAIHDAPEARQENRGRVLAAYIDRGGGLAGFALATDDLAGAIAAAWAETVPTSGPHSNDLHRFDGSVLHWHGGEVAGDPWGRRMPTLIEYEASVDVPALYAVPGPHPLGVTALVGVTICTRLVFEAVDAFRRYLHIEPEAVGETQALVRFGSTEVEFLAPEVAAVEWVLAAVPEQEGLFGVTLAVADLGQAQAWLRRAGTPVIDAPRGRVVLPDLSRACNARFRLAPSP